MSNKTKRIIFIMFVFMMSFLFMTTVRAEVSWDGDSKTITIPCGEEVNPYLNINDWIDPAQKPANNNRYTITENTGISILSWNQPMTGFNADANSSYYDRMNVASGTIGQQVITIRFTPNGANQQTYDTTLTVNCVGSENLKTVVEALGGQMPNLYTLNTEDVYTSLDNLTGAQYEAILDSHDAYSALTATEKNIADQIMTEILNRTEAEIQEAANDGIERLANDFVSLTKLTSNNDTDLESLRKIYEDIPGLSSNFGSLSPRTKTRVLNKLANEENTFSNWEEVEQYAKRQIDLIDAQLFLKKFIKFTDEVLDEEAVLAGEETWNNLNDNVKSLVNEALSNAEKIKKTYPELLIRAKANKFLQDKLTKDNKVIIESNNSNYQQILDAKEDYEALPDEVEEMVNSILTDLGNTTYPELLKDAQKLQPTPKTGDEVVYVVIALVVSALGLVATFIKRKK